MKELDNRKKWQKPEFTIITTAESAENVMHYTPGSGTKSAPNDNGGGSYIPMD